MGRLSSLEKKGALFERGPGMAASPLLVLDMVGGACGAGMGVGRMVWVGTRVDEVMGAVGGTMGGCMGWR